MPPSLKAALSVLKENEPLLRARGVRRAAVFGSVARGDADSSSDVDILVEIDAEKRIGLFGYAGLCADIESLFPGKVDVVNANTIKPRFRQSILSEAVYAF
ncbi:MAG: nucleotidyltransferase family protein [Rhizomicrobium sp.]|nr:nucleotidyltransferase family protein [Rhizomicrobium sp.]